MDVKITKEIADAVGPEHLVPFGVDRDAFKWRKTNEIRLTKYSKKDLERLFKLIEPHPRVKGARQVIADLKIWLDALNGATDKPVSNPKAFEAQLRAFLIKVPGHRLFKKEDDSGAWQCYFVSETEYHPATGSGERYQPAYATMDLVWVEMGGRHSKTVHFSIEDVREDARNAQQILAADGYVPETPELRAEYVARRDTFNRSVELIGKQFLARGVGDDSADGNDDDGSSRYWRHNNILLDKGGEPSRVVMDVFYESDESRHDRNANYNRLFWMKAMKEMSEEELEDQVDLEGVPSPEIPLHATAVVFDLKRHMRLKVDITQLEPYAYDPKLGDKLILPADSRNLVEMLLAHRAGFRDIVSGKSGGAVILCAGLPGTGKTLTAEVYAEVMARPLFTVQASQLGTEPSTLEKELLRVFARSARWGAILLLDEADVYVRQRGDDLIQNAIVGVFLRVMEYYKGVLFMTTNRADMVDDAIASRCIARIDYNAPSAADQTKIWNVLSSTAGIEISADVIAQAVSNFTDITGRDIKNLLKLAKLVADSREMPITFDVLRFVKRFKPTGADPREGEAISLPPIPERPPEPIEEEPEEEEEVAVAGKGEDEGSKPVRINWKRIAEAVFEDGAPHAASEVKEAVTKACPGVHPNAVTMAIVSLAKQHRIERLESGLYRKVGAK